MFCVEIAGIFMKTRHINVTCTSVEVYFHIFKCFEGKKTPITVSMVHRYSKQCTRGGENDHNGTQWVLKADCFECRLQPTTVLDVLIVDVGYSRQWRARS